MATRIIWLIPIWWLLLWWWVQAAVVIASVITLRLFWPSILAVLPAAVLVWQGRRFGLRSRRWLHREDY